MQNSADFGLLSQLEEATPVPTEDYHKYDLGERYYATIQDVIIGIKNRKKVTEVAELLPQLSLNGVVVQDEMETYLTKKGNSASAIKEFLKTPLAYRLYVMGQAPRKKVKAFELGTFCHLAFLEPKRFDDLVVEPDASLSTVEGVTKHVEFWETLAKKRQKTMNKPWIIREARKSVKRKKMSFEKNDGRKEYIQQLKKRLGAISVDADIKNTVDCIKRNYDAYGGGVIAELLAGAASEVSMYGKDVETGLTVKIRPDMLQLEENIGCNAIISFKTTSSDTKEQFEKQIANLKYDFSDAMYLDMASQITGRKFTTVITIMLQTQSPNLVAVGMYDWAALDNARYQYRSTMQTLKEAIDADVWPGFDSFAEEGHFGIIQWKMPAWTQRHLPPMTIAN